MSASPNVRSQLESLRIPKEQRPATRDPRMNQYRAPRRIGRRVVLVVLLVMVAAGVYGAWTTGMLGMVRTKVGALLEQAAPDVTLLTVLPRTQPGPEPVLTATGKIVSDHTVSVSTKVSGQVMKLYFEQGDKIAAGQLLAEIEDVNYLAQRNHALAMLNKARADLDYQKWNQARIIRMHEESGVATDVEMAQMTKSVEEAKAQVAADEAQLAFAQKALSDCRVVAPIAGTVLERSVEVGDFVAAEGGRGMIANAVFARIADMTKLRVEVDVNELDITRLHKDMPCRITPDAYKERIYTGHVMWLDPGANYSKATVQVKVRIDGPDAGLRVEGTAKVAFYREEPSSAPADAKEGLWIPQKACIAAIEGKTARVFVAVNGRLKATQVTIGRTTQTQVEIVSGLKPGDRIAIDKVSELREGQRVQADAAP